MRSGKREDAIKDRFVEFLKVDTAVGYQAKGQDVKNRDGSKNFDYLLVSSTGESLALEITSLIDYPRAFAERNHGSMVIDELRRGIDACEVPGRYLVLAPSTFFVFEDQDFYGCSRGC